MKEFISGLLLFIVVTGLIFGSGIFMEFKSAQHDAAIYNEKFGTHYSTSDFFFSGRTIKKYIHEGQQSKLNVGLEVKNDYR